MMSFSLLSWLFAAAITLHNLEEALWLPGWSQSAGRWHHPVGKREFHFAAILGSIPLLFAIGRHIKHL